MKKWIVGLFFLFVFRCLNFVQSEEIDHEFMGYHLVASYTGCHYDSLIDINKLELVMEEAVRASGATILSSVKHVFPPFGLTIVFLLSESHASIHTYPEYKACFVDLFKCGKSCDVLKFEAILSDYLKPLQASKKLLIRHSEISYPDDEQDSAP